MAKQNFAVTTAASGVAVTTMGSGPALVLLHGWGLNSAVWHQITDSLSRRHTLYLVDLPGFGHSRELLLPAELPLWADAVAEAIPEPATWLGWSLGGLVATQAALRHPARISRLITVASSPKFVAGDDWRGIQPQVLADFQAQLANDFRDTLARFLAIQAMGSETARADIKQLQAVLAERPEPAAAALAVGLELLAGEDLRPQLASIRQPFLRLYGRLDGLVPRKTIALVDQLAPASVSEVLPKASHAPFISHPEAFLAHLDCFLNAEKTSI